MQRSTRGSIGILLVAFMVAAISVGVAKDAPRARYIETYVASGEGGLRMKLQMLKPLASLPATGWLNSADEKVADGRFGGSVKKPFSITTKPDFVVFETEKRGTVSAGRYTLLNGVLTICMWSPAPGAYGNATELAAPTNYTLCAPMELKG